MIEKLSGNHQLINGVIEMSLSRKLIPLLMGIIIISFVFFTGCITTNSPANTSLQQTPISPSIPTQTITSQTVTSEIPTTTAPNTTNISPTPSPGPVFTETGRPVTDANGTQILSKVQAWTYAKKYLDSYVGLRNIQSSEVTASDPKIFTYKNNSQELLWAFEINRKSPEGFERGGIIFIDAYDGHVVDYSQFM